MDSTTTSHNSNLSCLHCLKALTSAASDVHGQILRVSIPAPDLQTAPEQLQPPAANVPGADDPADAVSPVASFHHEMNNIASETPRREHIVDSQPAPSTSFADLPLDDMEDNILPFDVSHDCSTDSENLPFVQTLGVDDEILQDMVPPPQLSVQPSLFEPTDEINIENNGEYFTFYNT